MSTAAELEQLREGLEPRGGAGTGVTGASPTRMALRRLRSDKVAVVSATVLLLLVALALLAPVITSSMGIHHSTGAPDAPLPSEVLEYDGLPAVGPPYHGFTWQHPLGLAPQTGVDNLGRLLYGLRTSLGVAVAATLLSTVIGVGIGLVGGFARGWADRLVTFVTDLFLSFPFILGALALAPVVVSRFGDDPQRLGRAQLTALVAVLVLFGWMGLARLVRGHVVALREREFIQAAQVIGMPTSRILLRELLPNLVAPVVVAVTLALPAFVAAEAGLSYLGIGLTGVPSLGQTINDAISFHAEYPLYLWAPVLTVTVLVLALNLLGDSVRDAFDPRAHR